MSVRRPVSLYSLLPRSLTVIGNRAPLSTSTSRVARHLLKYVVHGPSRVKFALLTPPIPKAGCFCRSSGRHSRLQLLSYPRLLITMPASNRSHRVPDVSVAMERYAIQSVAILRDMLDRTAAIAIPGLGMFTDGAELAPSGHLNPPEDPCVAAQGSYFDVFKLLRKIEDDRRL